jgi:hypothetical protein
LLGDLSTDGKPSENARQPNEGKPNQSPTLPRGYPHAHTRSYYDEPRLPSQSKTDFPYRSAVTLTQSGNSSPRRRQI